MTRTCGVPVIVARRSGVGGCASGSASAAAWISASVMASARVQSCFVFVMVPASLKGFGQPRRDNTNGIASRRRDSPPPQRPCRQRDHLRDDAVALLLVGDHAAADAECLGRGVRAGVGREPMTNKPKRSAPEPKMSVPGLISTRSDINRRRPFRTLQEPRGSQSPLRST
jgi:hypothetical protein